MRVRHLAVPSTRRRDSRSPPCASETLGGEGSSSPGGLGPRRAKSSGGD